MPSGLPQSVGSTIAQIQATYLKLLTAIRPSSWVTPILLNSWEQYEASTGTYQNVSYRVEPMGKVVIRGLVKHPSSKIGLATANNVVFILPESLWPPKDLGFTCNGAYAGSTAVGAARVDVTALGEIRVRLNSEAVVDYQFLDGISFWPR
jgi:hypothetical protein